MTVIRFADGTSAETPLTHDQLLWLQEQVRAKHLMACKLIASYEGVNVSVDVMDVKLPDSDTIPAPSPFWE